MTFLNFKIIFNGYKIGLEYYDDNLNTLLMLACYHNPNINIIKYLIEKCDMSRIVHHTNNNNEDCMMMACMNNKSIEIIQYLLSLGPWKTFYKFINCACTYNSNINIIKYLFEKYELSSGQIHQYLVCACWKTQCVEILDYLVMKYISIDQFDKNHKIVFLLYASHNPNINIIKYLLESKLLHIDFESTDHKSILKYACQSNNFEVLKYLVEEKNINTRNINWYDSIAKKSLDTLKPLKPFSKQTHYDNISHGHLINKCNTIFNILIKTKDSETINDFFKGCLALILRTNTSMIQYYT